MSPCRASTKRTRRAPVIAPLRSPIGRPPIAQAPAEGRPRPRTFPASRIAGAPTAQPAASPAPCDAVHERASRPSSDWSAPGRRAMAATPAIAATTKTHVPKSPPTLVIAPPIAPDRPPATIPPRCPSACRGRSPPGNARHPPAEGEPLREADSGTEHAQCGPRAHREDEGSPSRGRDSHVGLLEDAAHLAAQRASEGEAQCVGKDPPRPQFRLHSIQPSSTA